jgi:hypothetical protein
MDIVMIEGQQEQNDESRLDRIAGMCLDALDPIMTREAVVQMIKDIYIVATPDDEDDEDDDAEQDLERENV